VIEPSGSLVALLAVGLACIILVPGVMFALGRGDAVGLCLGILGAAITTSCAALCALAFRTPTVTWLVIFVPLLWAVGVARATRHRTSSNPRGSAFDPAAFLGAATAALSTGWLLARAPVAWDGRSIWFFHASWLRDPQTVYAAIPAAVNIHADYPPFAASFGAFAWLLADTRNDWLPQIATGVLAATACSLLAILVVRSATTNLSAALLAALGTMAFLGVTNGRSFDGYQDGLLAALVAIVALLAFTAWDTQIALIAAVALALTKNEGLVFLVVILIPAYLLAKRPIRSLMPGLVLGVAWLVGVRMAGLGSDGWILDAVLPWSGGFLDRLSTIGRAMVADPILLLALILWIGAVLAITASTSQPHLLRTVIGMGAIALALLIVEAVFYLATPADLTWHLTNSVDRLVLSPAMVLTAAGLVGTIGAWGAEVRVGRGGVAEGTSPTASRV
jgi:hypothetical protein